MRKHSVLVLLCGFSMFFAAQGCASLSGGQMKAVDSFAASCDSFSKFPGGFFEEMARLRVERGLYFSASLSDPQLRVEEINSVYSSLVKDLQLSKRTNLSLEILTSYQRALKVLSGKGRWQDAGREMRSLGRSLDSLVLRFNALGVLEQALPIGIGKSAGKLAGYTAEIFVKRAQSRAVKQFVIEGDTLINALVENLVKVLRTPAVTALIENEKRGLEQNYITYLRSVGNRAGDAGNRPSGYREDREYMALKERVEKLATVRGGVISASNRLAKAHSKLASEFTKRKKLDELYTELLHFEKEVTNLQKEVKNVVDKWPYSN